MKILLFNAFACVILLNTSLFSQTENETFCEDSSYRVLQRLEGDIVRVTCDTVYVLNASTFHLLYSSYQEYQTQSQLLGIFTDSAEALIDLYSEHVEEQKEVF